MTVKSVDDVRNLNRKTRNKMSVIKEGQPVHEVIIQEGVYTFESVTARVAEPVVYMMDQFVVGGFYRVHTDRGIDENLNSPGAEYVPLAFETDCQSPDCAGEPGDSAQPLLHLRRGRAPGDARRRHRGRGARRARPPRWRSGRRTHEVRVRGRPARPPQGLQGFLGRDDARGRAPRPRGARARGARHAVRDGSVRGARAAPRDHRPTTTHWYRGGRARSARSPTFDVVMMRKDPPFDQEYYYATLLLERVEAEGARVVNRPRALRDWNEKLAILRFPQFTPPTLVAARHGARARLHRRRTRDVIVKKLDGMGGTMIFRVRADDPNRNVIVETHHRHGRAHHHGAALHPRDREGRQARAGDRRQALRAIASRASPRRARRAATWPRAASAWRSRSRRATARSARGVGPRAREATASSSPGLDVIGDWLTEVNVTSPTCIVEIADQTAAERRRRPAGPRWRSDARAPRSLLAAPAGWRFAAAALAHRSLGAEAISRRA